MEELDDDHGVESIRTYVRNHPDIKVYKYVKRGINGLVYFGKRIKLGDEVVLKFYWSYPDFDSSEEAVILRSIDHPNILRILDLRFIKPNSAYFLSPKIPGGDLQEHIDSRSISSKDALTICAGILVGTTELHSNHGLVHRDLKPGNILIDTSKKNIPIIADLGAVKKIEGVDGYTTESKATLYYLPPESIAEKKYHYQSDIYQIGLILFQLLGGFFPISNPELWLKPKEKQELDTIKNDSHRYERFEELIKEKIFKGKLANTDSMPPYLDPPFKKLINKALHIDYTKRFKNTSEFLQAVHKLLSSYPDYNLLNDNLIVTHDKGKTYKIYKDGKGSYQIEKMLPGKEWRKDNNHNGEFSQVLGIAKIK